MDVLRILRGVGSVLRVLFRYLLGEFSFSLLFDYDVGIDLFNYMN